MTPSADRRGDLVDDARRSGRLISLPRTAGTMQKAQELSQPTWMVTQPAQGTSRLAGQRRRERLVVVGDGCLEDLDDRAPLGA